MADTAITNEVKRHPLIISGIKATLLPVVRYYICTVGEVRANDKSAIELVTAIVASSMVITLAQTEHPSWSDECRHVGDAQIYTATHASAWPEAEAEAEAKWGTGLETGWVRNEEIAYTYTCCKT